MLHSTVVSGTVLTVAAILPLMRAYGPALFHQGILPADAESLAASVQSLQKSQPLGIVQAPNWYEAKSPIFRLPPPAVPRPKSQEVLRRNGVSDAFRRWVAMGTVNSP